MLSVEGFSGAATFAAHSIWAFQSSSNAGPFSPNRGDTENGVLSFCIFEPILTALFQFGPLGVRQGRFFLVNLFKNVK